MASTPIKIRTAPPYRIDWKAEADGNAAVINKQLGKTCQDIDYMFQIVFEALKAIIAQLNTLNAAGAASNSVLANTAAKAVIQGIPQGLDGNDGEDAFSGIIALPIATTGTVNLGGSEVTGILPQNHGGTGEDLSASTGVIATDGAGNAHTRTITAGSGIAVTNGSGASGNPTISVSPAVGLIQTVQAITSTATQSTSGSYTDVTNLTATITPTSASNRIRVQASILISASFGGTGANPIAGLLIVRGSTTIQTLTEAFRNNTSGASMNYLDYIDSPASTSALTYKIQLAMTSGGSGSNVTVNDTGGAGFQSSITLTEIV